MERENPNSAKKLRELRAFETLRAIDCSLPLGDLVLGVAGEEPDFLIKADETTLGVEVTEYFTPSVAKRPSLKAREKITDEIAREATRECRAAGLKNLWASVEFHDDTEIRKGEVAAIAKSIASIVTPAATHRLPTLRVNRRDQLPRGVVDIWAHHRNNVEEPFVGPAWGGRVAPADENELSRLVARKEEKLNVYRRHCSAVWLLLLVDPYSAASMAYVPAEFRLRSSGFDRVTALQGWSYTIDLWNVAT
jgi:hypothetical protein